MNPGIACTFHTKDEKIKLVTLETHPDSQLHWSTSPNTSPHLQNLISQWMDCYLSKKHPPFHLPLDLSNITPFTLQVLHLIQKVPFGQTISYFDIAEKLNKPQASRAVGQACGRNPFPLIIPCHRILAKNNSIGGFSCGLPIKHFLLHHELEGFAPQTP